MVFLFSLFKPKFFTFLFDPCRIYSYQFSSSVLHGVIILFEYMCFYTVGFVT